jgi:hypothetical protein
MLFVIAIVAVLLILFRQGLISRRSLIPSLAIFAIPVAAWPAVTNEFNAAYWVNLPSGYQSRAEAAKEAFGLIENSVYRRYRVASADNEPAKASSWLFGSGLGFYALNSDDGLMYPHNLPLETYLESGPLALVALIGALLLLLIPIMFKIAAGTVSRYELIGSASAVVLFLASLKTGDISSVGPILFFAIAANAVGSRTTTAYRPSNSSGGKLTVSPANERPYSPLP